jgi:hypothetical protein
VMTTSIRQVPTRGVSLSCDNAIGKLFLAARTTRRSSGHADADQVCCIDCSLSSSSGPPTETSRTMPMSRT